MPQFTMGWSDVILLVVACAAYVAFLWMNFRAGRNAILYSSIGIIFLQALSAMNTNNTPAYLAAAGFHAALVGCIFTVARKNARVLVRESASND